MARHSSIPTLLDECKTITISFLKKYGYLKPNNAQSGVITWSRNGVTTGTINIRVNTTDDIILVLDYKCNGKPGNYSIHFVSVPLNLGKGNVSYFLCPTTGKRCRKLYLGDTYFLHRDAFKGCFYDS